MAFVGEDLQSAAYGAARDGEALAENTFGRKSGTGWKIAIQNLTPDRLSDLLVYRRRNTGHLLLLCTLLTGAHVR